MSSDLWKFKSSIWMRLKVEHPDYRLQVDGAVDVREERTFGNTGRRRSFGGGFPLQVRGQTIGFDHQQNQVLLVFVILLGNRDHLLIGGTMDEAFRLETFGTIIATLAGLIPGRVRRDVVNHTISLSYLRFTL